MLHLSSYPDTYLRYSCLQVAGLSYLFSSLFALLGHWSPDIRPCPLISAGFHGYPTLRACRWWRRISSGRTIVAERSIYPIYLILAPNPGFSIGMNTSWWSQAMVTGQIFRKDPAPCKNPPNSEFWRIIDLAVDRHLAVLDCVQRIQDVPEKNLLICVRSSVLREFLPWCC